MFYVAVKGDYNGDGEFGTNDLAIANRDLLNKVDIDPMKALIMGAENGGPMETQNLAVLNRIFIDNGGKLTWD